MPTINTKQFAWSDVRVVLLGRDVVGLRGVTYTKTTEKEFVYGRGSKPLAIQSGNKATEGTLTLLQSELEALTAAVKVVNAQYDITDVSFDLIVSYADGADAKTDILKGVEISEYEKGMAQNDKFMEIELSFMALDVVEQA